MHESQVSGELTMQWAAVVDATGRTRMEARWMVRDAAELPSHVTHAA